MVGMVETTSPSCNRYSSVVFPAESNPRINILSSLFFDHEASDDSEEYSDESVAPICSGLNRKWIVLGAELQIGFERCSSRTPAASRIHFQSSD